MNRHHNTTIAGLLTFVLLYYGVAWAVLSCLHENDHGDQTSMIVAMEGEDRYARRPISHHASASVDCLDLDFHTEALGASSASPHQYQRLVSGVFPVNDGVTLGALVVAKAAHRPWLKAVFDRFGAPADRVHTPRYLSLSVLRV